MSAKDAIYEDMIIKINEEMWLRVVVLLRELLEQTTKKGTSRAAIDRIVDEYEACEKYSLPDRGIQTRRIGLKGPFHRIHIDVVGPLPKT